MNLPAAFIVAGRQLRSRCYRASPFFAACTHARTVQWSSGWGEIHFYVRYTRSSFTPFARPTAAAPGITLARGVATDRYRTAPPPPGVDRCERRAAGTFPLYVTTPRYCTMRCIIIITTTTIVMYGIFFYSLWRFPCARARVPALVFFIFIFFFGGFFSPYIEVRGKWRDRDSLPEPPWGVCTHTSI